MVLIEFLLSWVFLGLIGSGIIFFTLKVTPSNAIIAVTSLLGPIALVIGIIAAMIK